MAHAPCTSSHCTDVARLCSCRIVKLLAKTRILLLELSDSSGIIFGLLA